MSSLDVALRLRLIDNVSGPAKSVAESLQDINDTAAGRGARARTGGRNPTIEALDQVEKKAKEVGTALGKVDDVAGGGGTTRALLLGGALGFVGGAAGAAFGALMEFANPAQILDGLKALEAQVTAVEKSYVSALITAEMYSKENVDRLRKSDTALGLPLGLKPQDIFPIRKVLSGAGYGIDEQDRILPGAVRGMAALDAKGENIGQTIVAAIDNLKLTPEQIPALMDQLATATKKGRFEADQLARFMPSLGAGYAALGGSGLDASAEILAMAEHIRSKVGTDGEAGNRLQNVFAKAVSPDVVKRFAKKGVDLSELMEQAQASGRSYIELLVEMTDKLTGGDTFKVAELFGDQQALEGLRALLTPDKDGKTVQQLKQEILGSRGVIDRDLAAKADSAPGYQAQLEAVTAAGQAEWGKWFQPYATRMKWLQAWFYNSDGLGQVERLNSFRQQDGGLAAALQAVEGELRILNDGRDVLLRDNERRKQEGGLGNAYARKRNDEEIQKIEAQIRQLEEDAASLRQAGAVAGAAFNEGLKAAGPEAERIMHGTIETLHGIANTTFTPKIIPQLQTPFTPPGAKVEPMSLRPAEPAAAGVKRSAALGSQTNHFHIASSDPKAVASEIDRRLARLGNSAGLLLDTA